MGKLEELAKIRNTMGDFQMNELCQLKGHMWYFSNRKDVKKEDIPESLRAKTHRLKMYGPDGEYLKEKRKRDKQNAKSRARRLLKSG